jgi:carbon monoxide dehydrogenase subunit G
VDIANSFELPFDPTTAWNTLLDIRRIMPCIPGAELLEVSDDGSTYKGKVSVKLGPVALAFIGTATFAERNEATRQARLRCRGNDSKGRGGVQADMTFQVAAGGAGSIVTVLTQLQLTGSVAQYGRGASVVQGVASQLTAQFATNLKASLSATHSAAAAGSHEPASAAAAASHTDQQLRSTSASPQQTPAVKPISGFGLLLRVLWSRLTGMFRKSV